MITLNEIKQEENFSHSLIITYPKTIQISHGVYDNVVDMMNICTMISKNIDEPERRKNVYGGRTPMNFFNDKPEFLRFIDYILNKHQNLNPFFNKQNWYMKNIIFNSWGNEIKKGDRVAMHTHHHHHLILYLTEGAPLILPELKINIQPKRGAYYIFPPHVLHGVDKIQEDEKMRYCLVANMIETQNWEKNEIIENFKKNI